MRQYDGPIPSNILALTEEISWPEAEVLIRTRPAEIDEINLDREEAARYQRYITSAHQGADERRTKDGVALGFADTEAACSATVSVSADEVRAAAVGWANDVGWRPVTMGTTFLVFTLRGHPLWGGPEAEVATYSSARDTRVEFRMRASLAYPGIATEVARAVEAFGNGVCHELALHGASVSPSYLAAGRQNRELLARIERIRRPAHWAILGALVPLPLLIGLVSRNSLVVVAVLGWLATLFFLELVVRLRTIGMRASLQIALLVAVCLPAIACTLAATIGAL